jgi:hypothetical protein
LQELQEFRRQNMNVVDRNEQPLPIASLIDHRWQPAETQSHSATPVTPELLQLLIFNYEPIQS